MWSRVVSRRFVQIGASKLQFLNKTGRTQAFQLCRISSDHSDTEWIKLNPSVKDEPYTLTEEQVFKITKGDPEKLLKLKELLLKLFIRNEHGTEMPTEIKLESFEVMLSSGSNQLTRMLKYFVNNRKAHEKAASEKEKQHLKLLEHRIKRLETQSDMPWLDYKMAQNCLFLQIHQRSVGAAYNVNALQGFQFGQKVVFDCSLEPYMWERELRHTVKHILLCYDSGRRSRRPFSLHLCNLDFNGKLMQYLKVQRPDILELPIGLHEDSYLNLYDRNKLVYVDYRCSRKLEYDPEDIYVLRAIVDRPRASPRGDKKAIKEKIRYAALPLDNFVQWKPKAHKYLCLHHCHNILLDVKNHGSWVKAVAAHLPKSRYEAIGSPTRVQKRRPKMNDDIYY